MPIGSAVERAYLEIALIDGVTNGVLRREFVDLIHSFVNDDLFSGTPMYSEAEAIVATKCIGDIYNAWLEDTETDLDFGEWVVYGWGLKKND